MMAAEEEDKRFAVIDHDPRFHKISQKARKVKIDQRFHGMFKDDRFRLKYTMDKRGRPVHQTSDEHLRKFYELSSSSSEEQEEDSDDGVDRVGTDEEKPKARKSGKQKLIEELKRRREKKKLQRERLKTKARKQGMDGGQSDTEDGLDNSLPDDNSDSESANVHKRSSPVKPRLRNPHSRGRSAGDHARGQGNVESSSDSDSEDSDYASSESDGDPAESGAKWGELDADALRSCNQTSRLALCNMDWDRVTSSDLLVLLNSFKPAGGVVHSVKVYPSEYGLMKMKLEDERGPAELIDEGGTMDNDEEDGTNDRQLQEKLRNYQVQRLKYYFAVVECDSVETASAIYDHCDGMEYQSSSSKVDLRFVPDGMTFDLEPKDSISEMPGAPLYKPLEFRTTALHQSRVELTWDETSHHRQVKTVEAFKKRNIEEMDVSAYLASSSEDEDGEDLWEVNVDERNESAQPRHLEEGSLVVNEDQQIAKYRALLKEGDKSNTTHKDQQMEMEITWEPGLKDTTEELVKKKCEAGAESTPWEKYLEKKKEKKKQRGLKKEEKKQPDPSQSNDNPAFSDDDLPAGFDRDDPFFKDSLKVDTVAGGKKTKKKVKGVDDVSPEDVEQLKKKQSELELLFMDDEEGSKKHFNLKAIMEHEQSQGKKLSRRKRKQKMAEVTNASKFEDNFEIDLKDDRFQAMFTSHLYALDPSEPQFKKTKATEVLVAERQRRREEALAAREIGPIRKATPDVTPNATSKATSKTARTIKKDSELSMLVKSVKNKTDQFQAKKLKRKIVH